MSTAVLPSSLTHEPIVDQKMSRPGWEWLILFCASCGKEGGRVLKCDIPNANEFAFWLCDPCFQKYGTLAGTYAVPDELFFKKVHDAQIEREGRLLEIHELLDALKDGDHYLSKLVRDRIDFVASQ